MRMTIYEILTNSERRRKVSKTSTVYDCTMIELDKHHHEKGNITVVENSQDVPFDVKRVYYLYDVPGGGEPWWSRPL